MVDKYIVPDTLCGKCGKRVLGPGEPAGLLGSPVCDCAEIVPAQAPPAVETHPIIGNMSAYRAAMSSTIRAGTQGDRSKWCVMCQKIGNTFGCLRCNGGRPTKVSW